MKPSPNPRAFTKGKAVEVLDAVGLNPRQRAFAEAYVEDPNATRAYMMAGYEVKDANVAKVCASQLLTKPNVAAHIANLRRAMLERNAITVERTIKELGYCTFFDPRRAFDDKGQLLAITKMPEDIARAIVSFEVDDKGETKKVRFVSKLEGIEKIGRHQGLWGSAAAPTGTTTIINNTQNNLNVSLPAAEAYKRMLNG